MEEGRRKIREGLTLLIDGMIKDTNDLAKNDYVGIGIGAVEHRLMILDGYFKDAIRYELSDEDFARLNDRYSFLKTNIANKQRETSPR